jgi:hypothetical protein
MNNNQLGRVLVGLTMAASIASGAVAFIALYRLRNDPLADLGNTFRFAAFLQPIPFAIAALLAIVVRRRPAIVGTVLVAVTACGVYGWWWLSGLEEIRRIENEPVRRGALGNILPDIEGQAGAVKAILWPLLVVAAIGGAASIAWLATRRRTMPRQRSSSASGS